MRSPHNKSIPHGLKSPSCWSHEEHLASLETQACMEREIRWIVQVKGEMQHSSFRFLHICHFGLIQPRFHRQGCMQFAEVTWISIRPPLLTWYLLASLLVYIYMKTRNSPVREDCYTVSIREACFAVWRSVAVALEPEAVNGQLQIRSKCQNPLETPITLINRAIRFPETRKTFFRSLQLIFPIDNVVLVHRRAAFLRLVSWACISTEEEIKIKASSVPCSHKTGGQRPHPLAGWCCQDLGRHTRNPAVLGTRLFLF